MVICNSHRVQYLSIYSLILKIYDVHLLTNALKSSLSAKSSKISTNISMGILGNEFQINLEITENYRKAMLEDKRLS